MKVFTIRYKKPFLLTCSLLFPLLAMLVGCLTYCTSSPSKREKLSVTDGDSNRKEKDRHPVIISPFCLCPKLPPSPPGKKVVYFSFLSSMVLCVFCHTRVPVLFFFFKSPYDIILTFLTIFFHFFFLLLPLKHIVSINA